ncbi:hypothetical protein [Chengkuizengella axinellae]|uniref:DUF3021 family protein n=1 Tax=Chengkuizengella axinellae TaxID=3064388 RepID=A0ABT9J1C8_9BACL|nr:hypothetical protein [Chengkuizengella sp. 2205SS18-9]MDP5275419.1 hypothetical protein [Chengkuizengella sp. 2205SS18-9]
MLIRKLWTFIITSLLSVVFIAMYTLLTFRDDFLLAFYLISIYTTVILFYCGIPVSILSDYVTRRFNGLKQLLSRVFIHLLFAWGLITIIIGFGHGFDYLVLYKTLYFLFGFYSILFWIVDEVLRRKYNKHQK